MCSFEVRFAFLSVLAATLLSLPASGEESQIIVEADGSKHWNNTYGNGYAAARILDRVAEMKRQDYEKARLGFQLEAEAMVREFREKEARFRAMLAKEKAEFDGLHREERRLEKEVLQSMRSRIDRAESEIFPLKVSDIVQVKQSHTDYRGIRGKIVKIESGQATVALEAGLSAKIPTRQLINLRALPLTKEERELVHQHQDAKAQVRSFLDERNERLESSPK